MNIAATPLWVLLYFESWLCHKSPCVEGLVPDGSVYWGEVGPLADNPEVTGDVSIKGREEP